MAFCSSCGSQVDQDTRFCHKCGQPVSAATPMATAPSVAPATPATYAAPPAGTMYAGPSAPVYARQQQYGGFWIRFVAHIVDSLILGIPIGIIMTLAITIFGVGGLAAIRSLPNNPDPDQIRTQLIPVIIAAIGAYAVFILAIVVIMWLYFALMESSERQATFGKAIFNMRVTDANGNRLSFGHASGRYFSKIISGLVPFGIGYIMAGFTQKKQALHDFIANTVVIRTM